MRILLLEDDSEKARKIEDVLRQASKHIHMLKTVSDVAAARAILAEETVDLLVLDVCVPFRSGEAPDDSGGTQLLLELLEDHQYRRPKYVVGITGVEARFEEASHIFVGHGWALLRYSPGIHDWANSLRYFVEHIADTCTDSVDSSEERADAVILTALESPEFSSVKAVFPELNGPRPLGNNVLVWEGDIASGNAGSKRIIAAVCWQMGLTSAAVLSERLLSTFRPKLFAMPGICAGFEGGPALGDVVIATHSWEWQGGKITSDRGAPKFFPAPDPYRATPSTINSLRGIVADKRVIEELEARLFRQDCGKPWNVHFGPMVSGLSVVASKAQMDEVRGQHRKVLGLDMEAYSVYAAAYYSDVQPEAVVIKGVCDFGNEEKADFHQETSAMRSALVLRALVEL